jgi:nucleoid-associated protein YgaU
MFSSRILLLVVVLATLVAAALSAARPTESAGRETRYVVEPGDTLWAIASERYAGDPREAIWRIKERNGLASATITPGEVLVMPP